MNIKLWGGIWSMRKSDSPSHYYEAEIEISVEDLARQLTMDEVCKMWAEKTVNNALEKSKPSPEVCEEKYCEQNLRSDALNIYEYIKAVSEQKSKPEPLDIPKGNTKIEELKILPHAMDIWAVMDKINEIITQLNHLSRSKD